MGWAFAGTAETWPRAEGPLYVQRGRADRAQSPLYVQGGRPDRAEGLCTSRGVLCTYKRLHMHRGPLYVEGKPVRAEGPLAPQDPKNLGTNSLKSWGFANTGTHFTYS